VKEFDKAFQQAVADQYIAGQGSTAIAKQYGISAHTVLRWARLKMPDAPKKSYTEFDDVFRQEIVDLYVAGHSSTVISHRYGISAPTILKWVRKLAPGTDIQTRKGRYKDFDIMRALRLERDMMSGMKRYAVGKKHGISGTQVSEIISTLRAIRKYGRMYGE
jgi:transposase-like protein